MPPRWTIVRGAQFNEESDAMLRPLCETRTTGCPNFENGNPIAKPTFAQYSHVAAKANPVPITGRPVTDGHVAFSDRNL
jgi:hypothetical protein